MRLMEKAYLVLYSEQQTTFSCRTDTRNVTRYLRQMRKEREVIN